MARHRKGRSSCESQYALWKVNSKRLRPRASKDSTKSHLAKLHVDFVAVVDLLHLLAYQKKTNARARKRYDDDEKACQYCRASICPCTHAAMLLPRLSACRS